MVFVLITFLAAFLIEGLGTAVSVIGLSTLFGANPIIIALAVSLDIGKLVVVSMLYKYWKQMGKMMKSYALIAAVITMVITSAGAAGYLSGEFQKAIMGTQEVGLKVDVLKQQQAKYEERKKQIDQQIAALPEKTTVNQRIRLINAFKAEQADLQAKINDIDKQLPELQIHQIGVEAKAGPILYIAKAFNIPVESAVKWVILMIIFVFDPLAVYLIIAGNFLLEHRKKTEPAPVREEPVPVQEPAPVQTPLKRFEVDEPGVGNSAVRFDEQIAAMPEELRTWNPTPGLRREVLIEHPVTLAEPEPEAIEPIIEEPVEPPATPVDAEMVSPAREQIRLEDVLPPPRSSLHDVRNDAEVVFEDLPSSSSIAAYKK